MPEHAVRVKTPELEVGRVDVIFTIRRDGASFGRLKVSRGGVEWIPSGKSKKAFHMPWDEFDRFFRENGAEVTTKSGKWK